jgi:hypothetical protein
MILVKEIPGEGIKIIFLIRKADFQIIREDVCHFIKSFKSAIVINDSFGTAEVCSKGEAHTVGFRVIEKGTKNQALNFFAFGTFSPLNIRSAPTFLPLPGQPYFGPNTLQEVAKKTRPVRKKRSAKLRKDLIEKLYGLLTSLKLTKVFR